MTGCISSSFKYDVAYIFKSFSVPRYYIYEYSNMKSQTVNPLPPQSGDLPLNYAFCYSTISNFQLHWTLKGLKYLEIYVVAELDEVLCSELFNYLEKGSQN